MRSLPMETSILQSDALVARQGLGIFPYAWIFVSKPVSDVEMRAEEEGLQPFQLLQVLRQEGAGGGSYSTDASILCIGGVERFALPFNFKVHH